MTIRRGTLKSFNAGTYRADVQLTGSLSTYLTGVAVSRAIASGEMVTGRNLALLFFEEGNPSDAVVTAVWT